MEKRIQEFIEDYIPKRITKETRYQLQAELENHIYERIDYYTEVGYSEEESLEKALKDFGDDEETKEQIKKEMGNIHIPWSLANFFAKSIPITVVLMFIGGTALHIFLFTSTDLRNFLLIPLILWLIIIALRKTNKIHHILKSIIAFILVIPYFGVCLLVIYVGAQTFDINLKKDNVISSYSDFMTISDDLDYCDKLYCLLPSLNEIGNPIDAVEFSTSWHTIFDTSSYSTWIFEYSPTEYKELKNKFNNDIEYMETYDEYDYYIDNVIVYKCDFSVYGFDFKTLDTSEDNDATDENYDNQFEWDYWTFIGTNDETHEIAFIYVSERDSSPTFDEYFIEEDCGWRYFYFLTKF